VGRWLERPACRGLSVTVLFYASEIAPAMEVFPASASTTKRAPTRASVPRAAGTSGVAGSYDAQGPSPFRTRTCHPRATSDGQSRYRADNHSQRHLADDLGASRSSCLNASRECA
jgi:hypothetical protein